MASIVEGAQRTELSVSPDSRCNDIDDVHINTERQGGQ